MKPRSIRTVVALFAWGAALGLAACDPGEGPSADGGAPSETAPDEGARDAAPERPSDGGDPDATSACTADCGARSCGGDGCGGTCGVCADDEMCSLDGRCLPSPTACGDGACGPDEDCAICPDDCGACCGDGVCQPGVGEDCASCPDDCGCLDPLTCVDGLCIEAPGQPPAIEALQAEPAQLAGGGSLVFTATVSDADGLDDLAGGALETPDGDGYGEFEADGPGAYAIELSWDEVHAVEPIDFAAPVERAFVARFSDRAGLEATATISVWLTCDGRAACGGVCVDVQRDASHCGGCGRVCDPTADCVEGRCRCGVGWFACDDERCVDEAAVCDGVEDCGGGADERGCCFDDAGCGPGAICVDNGCVAGCRDHAGCPVGRQCRDGQCVAGCEGHGDCAATDYCDPEGRCRLGCRGDAICGAERQCVAGECVDRCDVDATCDPGRICRAERCVPGCAADRGLRGCAPGRVCVADACVSGCLMDAECDVGRICAARRCVQGCRDDAACRGGSRCLEGACRWALTGPDDAVPIDGGIKADGPVWTPPALDCTDPGGGPAYRYDALPVVNLTGQRRRVRVRLDGRGRLHVFGAAFDPWRIDGCVAGTADDEGGSPEVTLDSGETLTVVVSPDAGEAVLQSYRVWVETSPTIGDPCPADGAPGFCPPGSHCPPEVAICTPDACGDGRVDGAEQCDDALDPGRCDGCRRVHLPIGAPCVADPATPPCAWGGVCEPGSGRCAAHAIAAPGADRRFEGALTDDDPSMVSVRLDCDGLNASPARRPFDAWRIVNPTGARRALAIAVETPDAEVDSYVFGAEFDPDRPAGCLSGEWYRGTHEVSLEPGEQRVVVVAGGRGAYTLVVETTPQLGDDCTAAGTDGRCPPEGFCHPDGGRCAPIVCGDGRVDGAEACDDGNAADRDGCVDCHIRPIAPGDPCRVGDPTQICDGGRCDPAGAICVREAVVPIAAPGEAIGFGGAFDVDDPRWWVLDHCAERVHIRHEATYDTLRVVNSSAEPREIVVRGAVASPHPVVWHVFSADFDPETYTGCLDGSDRHFEEFAGEPVPIGPGEQRVVVVSSWWAGGLWAPPYVYSVSVETAPAVGDDCSAAGTDGRCPPDAYCHPEAARCEAAVCGDGEVHGLEECDDGDADPTDGCAACRRVPIALGDACVPGDPTQRCDGGLCDEEQAICVAHSIAPPGHTRRFEGSVDLDAPRWSQLGPACRATPDPPRYHYHRVWLTNPADVPRTVTATLSWPGQGRATLHVFDAGLAPPGPDGCLADAQALSSPISLSAIVLPPGATRALVVSTQSAGGTLPDYVLEVETHPLAGDDCSAAGTDGRCPPDGRCEPQTLRCVPAVCGDGRVEGLEACDDGNAVSGDGCVDCREAPIAIGNPCGPGAPHARCDGGLCDLAGGVCRVYGIPPAGHAVSIDASLDFGGPLWAPPEGDCTPRDTPPDRHFDVIRLENPTATARTIALRAAWPNPLGTLSGQLFVFDADFDPETADGCLGSATGAGQAELVDVPIGPGDQRIVVLTSALPGREIPAYTLVVETAPALADDCSAQGTDGRCPWGSDCHPETERCAEVGCGDGWIGGDEQCDDGDDDPLDGCDACRLVPIPIGERCPPDGPAGPCDGGFCDADDVCRAHVIAAPGRTLRMQGALHAADPEWARPGLDCAPPAQPFPRRHAYDVVRVRNPYEAARRITITATWGGDADGVLFVFDETFRHRSADGCVAADDDFESTARSRLSDVVIGPGEERVIVASTYASRREIPRWVIEVETLPDIGDDCSAGGTAGRCPPSAFCEPAAERCAPAVCGDGRVDGDEACEDGNADPRDGCADCRLAPIAIGDACPGVDPRALCDGGRCDPESGRCAPHVIAAPGEALRFDGALLLDAPRWGPPWRCEPNPAADRVYTTLRLVNPTEIARVVDVALDDGPQAGALFVFEADFDPHDPSGCLAATPSNGEGVLSAVPIGPGEERVVVVSTRYADQPLPAYALTVGTLPALGDDCSAQGTAGLCPAEAFCDPATRRCVAAG